MTDFVQSIQIAPNGVVTDIYPEAGNEAGKIDLIHDESRGEICRYGEIKNIVTMQGPFDLKTRRPGHCNQKSRISGVPGWNLCVLGIHYCNYPCSGGI